MTIKNSADRLTKDQIEAMIRDAKKFEQQDKDTARNLEAQSELKRFIETQKKQPGVGRLRQKDSRKFFRALGAAEDFIPKPSPSPNPSPNPNSNGRTS